MHVRGSSLGLPHATTGSMSVRGLSWAGLDRPVMRSGLLGAFQQHRGLRSHDIDVALEDGLLVASCQPAFAQAANLIADAVEADAGILVFGDYDVDGITSTAIWKTVLRAYGVRCETKIPTRAEGYGFTCAAAGLASGLGCGLVLCVDSGTDRVEEVEMLVRAGIKAVVVDHHLPKSQGDGVSRPHALLNGHFSADPSMRLLCAAGQSYALALAVLKVLRGRGRACPDQAVIADRILQLATVGTVSDMMELRGLNRAIVREGLARINVAPLPALKRLAEAAGARREIKADTLGYMIGPMINASGRYSRPDLALDLLLSDDPLEQAALVLELDTLNRRRRDEQKLMVDEAMDKVDRSQPVAFYAGFGWEKGLVGLVAGGVMQSLQRPALVGAIQGDLVSGSGRSTPGFDLGHSVIEAQKAGLILTGGGHAAACGFSCRVEQLPAFLGFLRSRFLIEQRPVVHEVDLVIDRCSVSVGEFDALATLAPFGQGWTPPRLAVEVTISDAHLIGEREDTLRLGCGFKAIAFRVGHSGLAQLIEARGQRAILIATPQVGEWQGARSAEMIVEDAILL